ncbi:helix-turn-helix domain-containing protein [Nocardia neocaledoniensis]|uniref:helix-turn-helix domain-containing protein n=1 Tax=Nocardia neocaledoniensis TaxID=236511 RepID=UPI002457E2D0|nr:helix-turn-helix domain-containing protein [Nocardia neocaledoniensis]
MEERTTIGGGALADVGTVGALALSADGWYTTEEVAALLKVDPSSLRRWRTAVPPQGPPFVHLSGRVTRYLGTDLFAYLRRNRTDPAAA